MSLTVADEGLGFPEEALPRLFEKFARFHRGDSITPGTGLGLMICRGFMTAMAGTIAGANRSDRQGAIFTLHFRSAIA